MPIVVRHDDPVDALRLGLAAGTAQGAADRQRQQRVIDARISEQFVRGAAVRNARPGFFERAAAGADRPRSSTGGRSGVQSFDHSGRVPAGGRPVDPEREQQAASERRVQQFRELVGGRPRNLAQFAAENELRQDGTLSSATLSRLGVPTPSEISGSIRAKAGLQREARLGRGGTRLTDDMFKGMGAGEKRSAQLTALGDFANVARLIGEREEGAYDDQGNMIPGPSTKNALDAKLGFLNIMDSGALTTDQLAAASAEFEAAGQYDLVERIAEDLETRRLEEMVSIAPQETGAVLGQFKAGVQAFVQDTGRPPGPEEMLLGMEVAIERVAGGNAEMKSRLVELFTSDHPIVQALRLHMMHPEKYADPFAQPEMPGQEDPSGGGMNPDSVIRVNQGATP